MGSKCGESVCGAPRGSTSRMSSAAALTDQQAGEGGEGADPGGRQGAVDPRVRQLQGAQPHQGREAGGKRPHHLPQPAQAQALRACTGPRGRREGARGSFTAPSHAACSGLGKGVCLATGCLQQVHIGWSGARLPGCRLAGQLR